MASKRRPPFERIAAEADPLPEKPMNAERRQEFIDRAVIALYASGWPQKSLFERAEHLWSLREQHLESN